MKEFAAAVLTILHDHEIEYAIGGSIASSFHGETRTTQDIDLAIQLKETDIDKLVNACEARDWYISRDEVKRAVQLGDSFSINDGFWKADFFVVKDDSFAVEAFQRRQQHVLSLTGQLTWFLTAEDIILHKLRWCGGKPLDKHVRDIEAILTMQWDRLDKVYITRRADALGAAELWRSIVDEFHHDDHD
jgi:hypothetical protein